MKKMISKNTVICFAVMVMALMFLPCYKVNAEQEWHISGQQENPVSIGGQATLSVTAYTHQYSTNENIDITAACTFQWCGYTGGDIYDSIKLTDGNNRNELNGEVNSTYTVNDITTAKQYVCLVTYNGETRSIGFSVYPDNGFSVKAVDDQDDLKVEYGKDAKIAAYVYAKDFTDMDYRLQKQNGSSWEEVTVNGVETVTVSSTCRKITYTVKSTLDNKGKYRIIATDRYGTTRRCDYTLRFALKVNYSPDVSVQSGKDVTLTVKPSIDETVDKDISFLYSWSYDGTTAFKVTHAGSLTLNNVTKNEKIYCSIVALDANYNNSGYASVIFNINVVQPAPATPVAVGTTTTVSGITFKVNSTTTVELTKAPKTKSVTIPDTVVVKGKTMKVTSIAANAFKNNKKITKVVIGKNITKIGKNAFYKCTKLKKITIKSKNLKSIGKNAFKKAGTKSLKIVFPKGKKKAYKKLLKKGSLKI